jgi:hypothetical protein
MRFCLKAASDAGFAASMESVDARRALAFTAPSVKILHFAPPTGGFKIGCALFSTKIFMRVDFSHLQ